MSWLSAHERIAKPRILYHADRPIVCHAEAVYIDAQTDLSLNILLRTADHYLFKYEISDIFV